MHVRLADPRIRDVSVISSSQLPIASLGGGLSNKHGYQYYWWWCPRIPTLVGLRLVRPRQRGVVIIYSCCVCPSSLPCHVITPSSCRDALLGILLILVCPLPSGGQTQHPCRSFISADSLAKMAKWQSSILSFCNAKRKRDCTPVSSDDVVDEETACTLPSRRAFARSVYCAASTANADFAYVYQVRYRLLIGMLRKRRHSRLFQAQGHSRVV